MLRRRAGIITRANERRHRNADLADDREGARRRGQGHPGRRREHRHDQEALRLDRRRVDRGEPARLPRAALHDRGRRGVHQRRDPVRRDDPPDARRTGRRSRSCSSRRGSSPGSRSTRARSRSRCAAGETITEGLDGLRERLDGVPRARRALRQVARAYSIGDGMPERVLRLDERARARALRRALPGGRARADRRARGADGRRPHDRAAAATATGRALQARLHRAARPARRPRAACC